MQPVSYNGRHHEFMAFWESIYRANGFEAVLEALIHYSGILPLSDLLHLAKCFRTRSLKYLLTLTRDGMSKTMNLAKMRLILDLGAPLSDLTPLGKMRDAYPLVISRVENINTLFENDAIMEGLLWLPRCLLFNAIRLDTIGRATRLFMLRVSWFMVWDLYDRKKRKVDKNPQTERAKGQKLTVFTSQWSIHFLDTVLLLIFSIEIHECIALDRESTHPLENFFGRVRKDSNAVNTPERMKAVIARTETVTEALIRLEFDQNIHGRANLAGVQLTNEPPTKKVCEIELATPIDPQAVALICLKAAHVCEGGLSPEEQISFLQFREYLTLLQKAADESWTSSEIDQRFIVGSGSRIVTLITGAHGAVPWQ